MVEKPSKLIAAQPDQCFNKDINRLGMLFSDRLAACNSSTDRLHQSNIILLQSIAELYLILMEYQKFHDSIEAANTRLPLENQPWNYHPLSNTPLLRVGLITLYRFIPIPLHDHPGAYGAQRVVSGKVHIRQYHKPADVEHNQSSIVSLKTVATHNLNRDECTTFQPDTGNLHEIKSLSKRSILLSMMIHPYKPRERSWYFPMSFPLTDRERLYNRVKRRILSIDNKTLKNYLGNK